MKQWLRYIPSVHQLQNHPALVDLQDRGISTMQLTNWLQNEIEIMRDQLLQGNWEYVDSPTKETITSIIIKKLKQRAVQFEKNNIRSVINGTGTVLHTNLGRARLSDKAIEQVIKVAGNYSNLEYNLEQGARGSRHDHLESLLTEVTGAEAAMVVNNNAAAVFLILRALAKEKEVIVSRGELVEIGGSFRVSAIMEESGAKLIEVGTTNKTHEFDYEQAINEETSMIMKVHTSNFKVVGFTKELTTKELVEITKKHDKIYYEDLGSGDLFAFSSAKIGDEPHVSEAINNGADIISFSGDKLLGGPQAGIIAGKKELIDQLKKHQLARVLRVDKMTIAALEATIKSYVINRSIEIPTVRDIMQSKEQIREKAQLFVEKMQGIKNNAACTIVEDTSQVGGGTMPAVTLDTTVVEIEIHNLNAQQIANKLRDNETPIIVRIKSDKVLLDFRTIEEDQIDSIVYAFEQIL